MRTFYRKDAHVIIRADYPPLVLDNQDLIVQVLRYQYLARNRKDVVYRILNVPGAADALMATLQPPPSSWDEGPNEACVMPENMRVHLQDEFDEVLLHETVAKSEFWTEVNEQGVKGCVDT
jgi:hypothetical protein